MFSEKPKNNGYKYFSVIFEMKEQYLSLLSMAVSEASNETANWLIWCWISRDLYGSLAGSLLYFNGDYIYYCLGSIVHEHFKENTAEDIEERLQTLR